MKQQIQIRMGNLSSDLWQSELQAGVDQNDLHPGVELLDRDIKRPGSTAAVDPQIVAATITGGAAIVVALIPIIADIFRKKSETPLTIVNVTLHGTANSKSIRLAENEVTKQELDEAIASIGSLTEINMS
ncbi:MAG: hypothetical protein ACE5IR_28555 [bacterium]